MLVSSILEYVMYELVVRGIIIPNLRMWNDIEIMNNFLKIWISKVWVSQAFSSLSLDFMENSCFECLCN